MVDSSSWKGMVVLVNFWATWCGPCRDELPDLAALSDEYKDVLKVIGMSIDTDRGDSVERFAREHGVNFPIVIADGPLRQRFPAFDGIPVTLLIDRAGRIVRIHQGRLDRKVIQEQVAYLAGPRKFTSR